MRETDIKGVLYNQGNRKIAAVRCILIIKVYSLVNLHKLLRRGKMPEILGSRTKVHKKCTIGQWRWSRGDIVPQEIVSWEEIIQEPL